MSRQIYTEEEKEKLIKEIDPYLIRKFFLQLLNMVLLIIYYKEERPITHEDEVLLVCGIANPNL